MKDHGKLVLFFAFTCFFAISTFGKSTKADSIPQTINIIGDKFYPPYEMLNDNGVPEGFCIDLIHEIMKRLGKPYTLHLVSRHEIMKTVKEGRADIVLELTYTNERAKLLHYGNIYNYAFKGAFYRRGDTPISSFVQFKGKRVCAEKGSYAEELLKSAPFKINTIPVSDLQHATKLLTSNKCDIVFCNLDIAKYVATHSKDIVASGVGLPPEKFCMAIRNEMLLNKINFIIYDLQKQGIYDNLFKKWIDVNREAFYLNIIYITMGIIFFLIVTCIAFYSLLKHKVNKATRKLERNQRSLDMSLRAGDIGIWGFNIKDKYFYNVFCDYFPEAGRPYNEELSLINPEDVNIFNDAMLSAISGNPPERPIIIRMDHSGKQNWRYVEKEIHIVRNSDGNFNRIVGTHKDITERIERENKIQELLDDHEIMFNNSSIGIQYFDGDGYMIKINDAACDIFGIDDKQAMIDARPNLFDFPPIKPYLDKNDPKCVHVVLHDDFDNTQGIPASILRMKHGIHLIDTYITPVFDKNHTLKNIIVNNSDLTEREALRSKLEEYVFRMQYILKSSGVLTWNFNPDSGVVTTHDECSNREENLDWKAFLELISEDNRDAVESIIKKLINQEIDNFNMQVKFNHSFVDESTTYYNIKGTKYCDKDGNLLYYTGMSVNITNLIEIQNTLKHEKEEALKADKLKSAFLANVSHEIRTPLNSIVGFSELLQYTENEEEKKQFSDIIKTNSDRLLKIIDDVLDMSKIESGTMAIKIDYVDLESIFHEAFEVFNLQLAGSAVELYYDSENSSCIIETDRLRFMQVLTNYMTNAIKYTEAGHIRLGYECIDTGIRIFVEDTGKGIPEENVNQVFERFEKIGSFVQGTGLGLSICKDIAKLLGGYVWVDSEFGKGSTFWMYVPTKYTITKK